MRVPTRCLHADGASSSLRNLPASVVPSPGSSDHLFINSAELGMVWYWYRLIGRRIKERKERKKRKSKGPKKE